MLCLLEVVLTLHQGRSRSVEGIFQSLKLRVQYSLEEIHQNLGPCWPGVILLCLFSTFSLGGKKEFLFTHLLLGENAWWKAQGHQKKSYGYTLLDENKVSSPSQVRHLLPPHSQRALVLSKDSCPLRCSLLLQPGRYGDCLLLFNA